MAFVKEDDLYQNFVKHVQDYMFNNTSMCKSLECKLHNQFNNKKIKQQSEKIESINKNIFIPSDSDSLFWCLYIIKNGISNYTQLTNRNMIVEKKMKIDYVERLRKEKQLIKQYKFDTITNTENMLANETRIDINTFLTLCVLGCLNIFFIKKNTYFELNMNDSNKIYIIKYISEKDKYGFEETNKDNLDDFRNKYYKVDNMSKPIKSMSGYKTQELVDICNKLGIETSVVSGGSASNNKSNKNNKNNENNEVNEIVSGDNTKTKSKKDLYESIIKYF
jgi:hypothetical protein